jgi:hypothetical protein
MLAVAQRVNGCTYRMLAVAPMDRAFCPILLRPGYAVELAMDVASGGSGSAHPDASLATLHALVEDAFRP